MKNQQVTYSTSRDFEFSSESQSTASPRETQGPREAGHKVALGILCLLLLMAIAVWLTYSFQYSEKNHNLQKALNNLTQQYHILQSTNSLMKEMLRNKSREFDDLKHQKELDSSNREQNKCCGKTKVLDCVELTGKYVERHFFCYGIKCYFILANKHWIGCKQTCQYISLSLLKIDDDDELKFLQFKINPNSYWIGLSYNARKNKWQWIDDDSNSRTWSRPATLYNLGPVTSLIMGFDLDYSTEHNIPHVIKTSWPLEKHFLIL